LSRSKIRQFLREALKGKRDGALERETLGASWEALSRAPQPRGLLEHPQGPNRVSGWLHPTSHGIQK